MRQASKRQTARRLGHASLGMLLGAVISLTALAGTGRPWVAIALLAAAAVAATRWSKVAAVALVLSGVVAGAGLLSLVDSVV